MQGNAIETRRFEMPDQRLDMKERGGISIVRWPTAARECTQSSNPAGPGRPTRSRCFFEIPPGHDAYVEGADRVELILFEPPEHLH